MFQIVFQKTGSRFSGHSQTGPKRVKHRSKINLFFSLIVLLIGLPSVLTAQISESFESVPPSGWTNSGTSHGTSGKGDGDCLVFAQSTSAVSIVTKAVTDPDRVGCWHQKNVNNYKGTFTVKYSTSDTGPWTNWITKIKNDISTTYVEEGSEFPGSSGTYYFQLERTGGSSGDLHIDIFVVTQSIVVSTSTLTGFTYARGDGPSPEQSFTVSAADLTANLVLTAPTNYEISKTSGSGFTSSLSYTPSSGTVSSSSVYVRLKSGLSIGSYNSENITASSTDKFSKTVTCSGSVTAPAAPTSFIAIHKGAYKVDITWTDNASGDDVIVLYDHDGGGFSGDPTDETSYAVNDVVAGGKVIYKGSAEAYSHTSLSANTLYNYKAWSVDSNNFYSASGVLDDATTLAVPPTPTNFISTPSGTDDINLTWTSPGTYDGSNNYQVLIIFNETGVGSVPDKPTDGDSYSLGNEDLGGMVIYAGDAVSTTAYLHESLTAGTYYYYAWHYNSFNNYSNRATDNAEPALPITLANFIAEYKNGAVQLNWETATETDNAHFLIYRDDEVIASLEGAGTTTEPHYYNYTDSYVVPGRTYTYVLADVSYANVEVKHDGMVKSITINEGNIGKDFSVGTAYPNPFNPTAVIPLNMAIEAMVTAELYDINGQAVQELYRGTLNPGSYDLRINGQQLAAGIYFVKIRIQEEILYSKVTLLK